MCLPHVSSIFKKIIPKTFGLHCIWSVFRWDLNVEQAREVFHAACEILFAMIEKLQMPHTTVCQLWKYLSSYSKLVDLCVWILFVLSEAESLMYGGF
jgi:hypothetical protein